jgi:hypothetical protein
MMLGKGFGADARGDRAEHRSESKASRSIHDCSFLERRKQSGENR